MKYIPRVSYDRTVLNPKYHKHNKSQLPISFTHSPPPQKTLIIPCNNTSLIFSYQPNPVLHRPSNLKKFSISNKQRLLTHKIPTRIENEEIKKIIEKKVKNQINQAKNRLSRKIESMNKIGVISTKANQVRGMSLLSIESSLIERKIPNFKRIATSEVLMKRSCEKNHAAKNSRSDVLQKIKSIVLRDYTPDNRFGWRIGPRGELLYNSTEFDE